MGKILDCDYLYCDGELRLIEPKDVTILTAWPSLESYHRRPRGKKRYPFWPNFKVLRTYRLPAPGTVKSVAPEQFSFDFALPKPVPAAKAKSEAKRLAFEAFRNAFPAEIAVAVSPFQFEQWAVLSFLRDEAGATDLLVTNPAMLYALAYETYGRAQSSEGGSPGLCLSKQRVIAEYLGFPGTDWAVKLLRKIPAESVHSGRVTRLKALCKQEGAVKLLQQLEIINAGVIEILADPTLTEAVEPSLIAEVSRNAGDRYSPESATLIRDTLGMAYDDLPRFRNLRTLREAHDTLTTEAITLAPAQGPNQKFPRPPVKGLAGSIVPIQSAADLIQEGIEQRNCVASYAGRVLSRESYIYRILTPERATLELVRMNGRRWQLGEFKAAGNSLPSQATIDLVEAWLHRCGIG